LRIDGAHAGTVFCPRLLLLRRGGAGVNDGLLISGGLRISSGLSGGLIGGRGVSVAAVLKA
jgi:hypothetical protein